MAVIEEVIAEVTDEVIELVIDEDNCEEIILEVRDVAGWALISKKEDNSLEMADDGLYVRNMDPAWSNSEW